MKILTLILVIFLLVSKALSQPDTMTYKRQVEALTDHASIQAYLDTIFKRDQTYRGDQAVTLYDLENLLSISYYVNAYGYPSPEAFGDASYAPRLIWIHNSFLSLRRLSFPLILKAFESGQISESDLRSYYLKNLYADRFDNDDIKDMPLPELYKLLDLNTSGTISILDLITVMEEKRKFNSLPKKEVLKWYGAEKSNWVNENGERKFWTTRGSPVEIITFENCKIYFRIAHGDRSYEPRELQKIGENKFRFKGRQSDKFFQIDADGNLLYRNEQEVFDFHLKQE
jgi:hypothetical protein